MSELKATRGPWVVATNGHFFEIGIECEHPRKEIPVYPTVCIGVCHDQEANAHLIAAAPDGYAFAQTVEGVIVDGNLEGDAAWAEVLKECRTFMAKARGES